MKALKKICTALMLLAFAFVFASCSSGSDSDDDDDQSITLSDGSYTLAITKTSDGMVEKYDIKATASNESLTFKSGSGTVTVDLTKLLKPDELAFFNAMSDAEKKAMAKKELGLPDDAEISFADNKAIVKLNLPTSELAKMQENYQLSSIPSGAKIETNKDNSKYKITVSKEGMQMEFHIKKD